MKNTITQKNIEEKVLEIIFQSFLLLAKELNWDKTKIENAKLKCLKSNLKIDFISKPKSSKNRKYKASIRVKIQNRKAILSVIFYDKNKSILKEETIITTFTENTTLFPFFDNPKWLDNDLFGYSFLEGNLLIRASISKTENSIVKNLNGLDEEKMEKLEGLARQLTFIEHKSFQNKLRWMNQ